MRRDQNVGFFALFRFYWSTFHAPCMRLQYGQINIFLSFKGYDFRLECVIDAHKIHP
jgi:hypothetical protein